MKNVKLSRVALATLLASSAWMATVPAQAQPMMGGSDGMHQGAWSNPERMSKYVEKRQAELKAKLHLTAAQEPAWNNFVQAMKPPAKPVVQPLDREELAKLPTPERIDKMNAQHEANFATMQTQMKQRGEATKQFYAQLTAEQQKVFDAQTVPHGHPMMGQGRQTRPD
jgi:Spy/CpxP family protein refolding chaperone